MKKELTAVDLFAGAGGLSEGFEQAGFAVIAANEIEETFSETYRYNHKDTKVFTGDITKINVDDFKKECGINGKKLNIVMGGPPCQGFSTANRHKRFIDDPRNILYKEFVKYVKELNPEFILMENVKGMKRIAGQVSEDFRKIGYTVRFEILNAKDFGIPQNRERLFFIGTNHMGDVWKDGMIVEKIFTEIKKNKKAGTTGLSDALWGLRKITPMPQKNMTEFESEEHGFTEDCIQQNKKQVIPGYIIRINRNRIPSKVYNHKARYNNGRDIEIFRRLPQGGKSDHPSIQDIMPYKNRSHIFRDKFYKLLPDQPCKTITSHMKFDCHMYIHPFESRGLSPREAARTQSFPDNYRFLGKLSKWYAQIGNAVPPLLASVIAKSILTTTSDLK